MAILAALLLFLPGCAGRGQPVEVLRLATTTSTADSGLLDVILPDFEEQYNARVEVVAVGTGQALALGENGDADVLLVHDPAKEKAFVDAGHGVKKRNVMYNDFVLVGPPADPARIAGLRSASEAFTAIASTGSPFTSRGDESGTHTKEQTIWANSGVKPVAAGGWYRSLGQGMGETLVTTNEMGAYTLTDRGTFLAMQDELPNLTILLGGETVADNPDALLQNPYGVIAVNPERHPGVNEELAEVFVEWLVEPWTQEAISGFGIDEFGQPLFYTSGE